MSYKSVAAPCEREKVIEKSRFLTYAAHTAGEEEARAFLASVRAQHPLATHVCYAFIADRLGNLQRFSDDGEPQGTAGMPILNVIKAQELYETTVAVVRYFGGIKLGAGGLTRAYSSCAAEALSAAGANLTSSEAILVPEAATDEEGNPVETGAQVIERTQLGVDLGLLVPAA